MMSEAGKSSMDEFAKQLYLAAITLHGNISMLDKKFSDSHEHLTNLLTDAKVLRRMMKVDPDLIHKMMRDIGTVTGDFNDLLNYYQKLRKFASDILPMAKQALEDIEER